MNERLKLAMAEANRKGWAPLSPIQASPFDSDFLGRALEIAPGQSLMHYLRLDRFKALLANGAIYTRRLDLFDLDPHEGRFPDANATQQASITERFAAQLGLPADALKSRRDFIEGSMRKLTYIHCWFGWDDEDQRMWAEYGDHGTGVCIRTTARRLHEALSLPTDFTYNLCGVTYSGDEHPISELISFLPACRKRPQFAHEREIRVIGQLGEKTWQDSYTDDGLTTPDFHLIGVNFERLFERVYVGPNASDSTFQEIEALANKAAGCRVIQRSIVSPFPIS